ncbi:MAG: hypothetical protein SGJ04_09830 [Bacteroidota bacterium]|nr:hypothetical protein [Bacteroidota bacterium]
MKRKEKKNTEMKMPMHPPKGKYISNQTARKELNTLTELGYIKSMVRGKKYLYLFQTQP